MMNVIWLADTVTTRQQKNKSPKTPVTIALDSTISKIDTAIIRMQEYKDKLLEQPKVEIVSPVVDRRVADYSRMPSYCNPVNYKILIVPAGYKIQYPGGTLYPEIFKTIEEAQNWINTTAKYIETKWLESGGLDY